MPTSMGARRHDISYSKSNKIRKYLYTLYPDYHFKKIPLFFMMGATPPKKCWTHLRADSCEALLHSSIYLFTSVQMYKI